VNSGRRVATGLPWYFVSTPPPGTLGGRRMTENANQVEGVSGMVVTQRPWMSRSAARAPGADGSLAFAPYAGDVYKQKARKAVKLKRRQTQTCVPGFRFLLVRLLACRRC